MEAGICGLGRIGAGMARRLARGGHEVVAWNRTAPVATDLAAEPENHGHVSAVASLEELVAGLTRPRHVLISLPAGDPTEEMVHRLADLLEPGDVIIESGNSNFRDSVRRAAELEPRGIAFLDMGVSGGIWGLEVGFCAMVGGSREAFDGFEPLVRTLAPPDGYLYCGPSGAGHYVKMVHNGIEYGLMEAYAEGFDILHASDYPLDLAAVARLWNEGSVIRSWLLELAGNAFRAEGNDLADVAGWVADSGEGRWTVAEAIAHDVPAPVITMALIGRLRSRRSPDSFGDRVQAALRKQFGGHPLHSADDPPA
jgi:6-phosphogluconate dehydrogenase